MNQVLNKFLTRQDPARSDLFPPELTLSERMRTALTVLSEFKDDPSIAERDPMSPLSFCCVTEEGRKSQEELYQIYQEGARNALSPLAPDGRPLRKYVPCRAAAAWPRVWPPPTVLTRRAAPADIRNGRTSIGSIRAATVSPTQVRTAPVSALPDVDAPSPRHSPLARAPSDIKQLTERISDPNKERKRPGRRQPAPLDEPSVIFMPSEPVTQEAQQVARIRRATVMPQSPADKHVIKGSMAKVIASGAGTSLQRRLLR